VLWEGSGGEKDEDRSFKDVASRTNVSGSVIYGRNIVGEIVWRMQR